MENIALAEFETIVNIDFGLIKMVKEKYNNPIYIDTEYLNRVSDNALIAELYERKDENPLLLILKDEFKGQADSLYEQFIESEYEEILEKSIFTNLLNFYKTLINNKQMTINILCRNLQEKHFIEKKLDFKVETIVEPNYRNIHIDDFNFLYLKDYSKILELESFFKMNVYICKYGFNMDSEDIPKEQYSKYITDRNQVYTIEVYNLKNILG